MRAPALTRAPRLVRRHPYRTAAIAAAVVIGAFAVASALGGDSDEAPAAGDPSELLAGIRGAVPIPGDVELTPPPPPVPGPRYDLVRVRAGARVTIRSAPEGRELDELGDRTEFGSPRALWIAERRGPWLGVPLPELPNGELGWVRYEPRRLTLDDTQFAVRADLSTRQVEIRYGDRVLSRFGVTVGRPGSETPPGDYAVTDALAGGKLGPYYGCCVLALSGHQSRLPPNWIGGDRIAIHGTPGDTGEAASLGCLRAGNEDMVALFALVPLGAPVFIRA